jgi:hypothetical protein
MLRTSDRWYWARAAQALALQFLARRGRLLPLQQRVKLSLIRMHCNFEVERESSQPYKVIAYGTFTGFMLSPQPCTIIPCTAISSPEETFTLLVAAD